MKKILMVLLFAGIIYAQNNIQTKFLVGAATVKKGYVAEYLYYYGKVTSDKEALVYPSVPGKLIKYLVKEGEKVKKDQVIALLDRDIPGVKTEPLKVKSPIDGVVAIEYGKIGQMMVQSTPLAMVYGSNRLVEFGVSSTDLSRIKVGQTVIIDKENKTIKGKIVRKSFAIDPFTLTAKVYAEVQNETLIPGAFVEVKVAVKEKSNALYVPRDAVVDRDGKKIVFRYMNGKAVACEVETGIEGEGIVEIKGNIQEGDTVITLGAEGLYDGALVELKGEVK